MPANNDKPEKPEKEKGKEAAPEIPEEQISQTQQSVVIEGEAINYTATAGTMVLKEEQDEEGEAPKPKASIFFIAYTKDDVEDRQSRPITFSFNGGPGSSSVWLHLGVLGPRRVDVVDEDEKPLPPPYQLTDNEYSLLDKTDLVFIDPVSTGFSRAVPGEKPKQFHDIKKDVESVGEFIRLYTTRERRWTSPKFLIGESYGTTRAAALSGYLQDRHGLFLNGIMLVSTVLHFQTVHFGPGNDMPPALFLPTYTATAWYHRRLPDELQEDLRQALDEAEAFASGEYTLALMKGAQLPKEAREKIAEKLARLTGLSRDYILRSNLRIDIHRFCKELLREQRVTVGRLDSRFIGVDRDAAGEKIDYDPSYTLIQGPFSACLNQYVRAELEFESDLPYEILTDRVHPWQFDQYQNQYVNVGETLREAMSKNANLKVFVANGYYDLATPYFATRYTINHLGLEDHLQANISMSHYEAGHMMYIHRPSLVQLKADLAEFIANSVPG